MAPEALFDPRSASEASDVFSLGALAYHAFSGHQPGASPADVPRTLEEHRGLKVSAVLDGAGPRLEDLIQWSTDPNVDLRIGSAAEFLQGLDQVEDERTETLHLAREWDALAQSVVALSPTEVVKREIPTAERLEANRVETERLQARMVALQEELDWLCYRLYGLLDADEESRAGCAGRNSAGLGPPSRGVGRAGLEALNQASLRGRVIDDHEGDFTRTRDIILLFECEANDPLVAGRARSWCLAPREALD